MDCFLLKTSEPDADIMSTIDSLAPLFRNIVVVKTLEEIQYHPKTSEWYGVFYDNEYLGKNFYTFLPTYFDTAKEDCLVLCQYSDEKGFKICPKIFRRHVLLDSEVLAPLGECSFIRVLDGFVWTHSHCKLYFKND